MIEDEEEWYVRFLNENEANRFMLSSKRASALGLMSREAMRLASGDLVDLVNLKYMQLSKIDMTLSTLGFKGIPNLYNVSTKSKQQELRHQTLTWQKVFKKLRFKVVGGLISTGAKDLALGIVGYRKGADTRVKQEQDAASVLLFEEQQQQQQQSKGKGGAIKELAARGQKFGMALAKAATAPLTQEKDHEASDGAGNDAKNRRHSLESVVRVDSHGKTLGTLDDDEQYDSDPGLLLGAGEDDYELGSPTSSLSPTSKRRFRLFSRKKN
jgi:hypothetical protein